MNFLAHASIAREADDDPRYALGAMLPDLAGMARCRLQDAGDARIAAGVALHHATDEAFHRAPSFLAACTEGLERLGRAGLSRGSARAVAHVGTELLLDGFLSSEERLLSQYDAALQLALTPRCRSLLHWRHEEDAARWSAVLARVAAAHLPLRYRDPTFVAQRLQLILAGRPRLALDDGQFSVVEQWAQDARRTMGTLAPALMAETRDALAARAPELTSARCPTTAP